MESKNIGLTYVALSRMESDEYWMLKHKIPFDRIEYINHHPAMPARRAEDSRLAQESAATCQKYAHLLIDANYRALLERFEGACNDGMVPCLVDS